MPNPKVAVVTGASRGLGAAFARVLAEEGYALALGARTLSDLERVAASLDAPSLTHPLDVTVPGSVDAFREVTLARFGRVDALIVNAGIGLFKPLEAFTPQEFEQLFAVNVTGAWLTVRAFLEPLKAARGLVVMVSSDVSTRVFPTGGPYCATKFALRALARTLQLEHPELRVLELRPGATDTYFAGSEEGASGKEAYLKAATVAEALRFALRLPQDARLEELALRPAALEPVY
ncbi:SDR family oxidoreductase [Marinithermus hydrothermalis]|uniref:Short-chain dehydrogenase/reductase SDR n=1 Tax=Marinithermus hydrothermalis (strain DSM 14884 / JCM 11576 / T1) TaxID=869210 RepID=F2NNR2_MARHT|nr:SDR family NAD(P)-dependent oxidoreductase [Marinithermus hydrothermalis]AEB11286.1 short-chain dehydrogenase/reductase SDR [Marinithermus hydrothermalis DSM 14884]